MSLTAYKQGNSFDEFMSLINVDEILNTLHHGDKNRMKETFYKNMKVAYEYGFMYDMIYCILCIARRSNSATTNQQRMFVIVFTAIGRYKYLSGIIDLILFHKDSWIKEYHGDVVYWNNIHNKIISNERF